MDGTASAESLAGLTRLSISSNTCVSNNGLLFEEESQKQTPLSPFGNSTNNSSRQKVLKTKPRGFDEETVASFSRCLQLDIQMEERIWGHLTEDLISEVLARVPPFFSLQTKVCLQEMEFHFTGQQFSQVAFSGALPWTLPSHIFKKFSVSSMFGVQSSLKKLA